MAIDAVKIPQNVYVEDRIVGPLTLRQVMIVTLGGGGSYAIWSSLLKAYGQLDIITTAIAWTPAVFALAFAFIRINDLSLMRLLLLMVEKWRKPTVRAFGPRAGISITIRTFSTEKKREHTEPQAALAKERKLDELSSVLDASLEESVTEPAAAQKPAQTMQDIGRPASEPVPETERPAARIPVDSAKVQVSAASTESPIVDGIQARSSIFSKRTTNAS